MLCEQNEQSLLKKAETLAAMASPFLSSAAHNNLKTDTFHVTHRFHTTFKKDRGLMDYLRNGACFGIFGGFDLLHTHVGTDMKYLQAGGDVRIGSAHVSADAKAMLYDDGKLDPALDLNAEVGAVIGSATAYLNIGNDYVSAKGEAGVEVGRASAQAKAVIKKDEISFKAEAGAAAVRGQIKGTFSIFGLKITATGIGDVGSVGASAEFSSKKGEFEFGTSASLLAGLGFKIHVSY